MKKNDIVILTTLKQEHIQKNLYENVNGIILKILPYNKSLVLFLNDNIFGDYAVLEVDNNCLKIEDIKLPTNFIDELKNSNKLNENNLLKKQSFDELKFNEYDLVELLVEDEYYSKYGIHKGDTGIVAINYAIENSILVDFSGIDKNGNYYGECISAKIEHLKLISKHQ